MEGKIGKLIGNLNTSAEATALPCSSRFLLLMRKLSKFSSPKCLPLSHTALMGMQLARVGTGLPQTPPPYLEVHFHQLIFLHKVVEPSCLQPGLCRLASLLQVDEDP